MKDTYILGIESSCDETAASVVKNGREVLSNIISSQVPLHTLYGGVVPEIASRKHIEKIVPCVREALREANLGATELSGVAVTYGPGLVGAVLVGVSFAKSFAYALNKPLIPVNHIAGHIAGTYLTHKDLEPPFGCLVVSGGHTYLVEVTDYTTFKIIGETVDDAAGEAFDKVARAIGLGYPGGPKIDREAKLGNPKSISFPKAKVEDSPYDFSFSGLKSAVLNYLNHEKEAGREVNKADLAASFQDAVVSALTDKAVSYIRESGQTKFALSGGVAANSALRKSLTDAMAKENVTFYVPEPVFCTDNAAMIASAGYYAFQNGTEASLSLNAVPDLSLEDNYVS